MTNEFKSEKNTEATKSQSTTSVKIDKQTMDDLNSVFNSFFGDVLKQAEDAIRK